MYQFIQSTHSHTRWLVLLTAVIAIIMPFINNSVSSKSKLPGLAFMIMCDIQLLMGLTLYFVFSPLGLQAFDQGMAFVMKTAEVRKIAVEHFILMLGAVTLAHIGYIKVKKATEASALKKASLIFFGLSLVLILAGIPWAKL
jgi:heme A synthase